MTAGEETYILQVNDEALAVSEAQIQEDLNAVPALSFKIPQNNPGYDHLKKLESEVVAMDMDSQNEVFRGRCLNDDSDFYNTKTVTCEGCLAYLLDVQYPPYVHTGSVAVFLGDLLDYYNSRVTDKQKIELGNVTVVDPNDYIRRESEDYDSIYNIIQNKLIQSLDGWIQIRRVNGKNYLDYLADYYESDQVIRFGENLLDLNQHIKGESIKTVIIPRGAENEETGERLSIASVNNGLDYIKDDDLVAAYGWIEAVVDWDDVTDPSNLLKKAQDYLKDCRNMEITIELSAVDARLLGLDVRRLQPGMLVQVISEPHHLNEKFLCSSKTTNLLDPSQDKVVLGTTMEGFTQSIKRDQMASDEKIESVNKTLSQEIQQSRDEFKEAIENASGLYETKVTQPDGSVITYYHDKKNLEDSQILMVFNTAGFGISSDGGQNWYGMQVDGDFIANILTATGVKAEWVRTGTMLADRIKGGTLELGGVNNGNGVIRVIDASGNVLVTIDNTGVYTTAKDNTKKVEIYDGKIVLTDGLGEKAGEIRTTNNGDTNGVDIEAGNSMISVFDTWVRVMGSMLALYAVGGTIDIIANTITIGGSTTKTGRAEFSDGSYLEFKNGFLVGGQTADGGSI
ncbi:MAG TPA: phage tail protein [Candidatus Scybalocola faecavium]|nr:phage tail protein [Candidatus Scybalocola faecavium]